MILVTTAGKVGSQTVRLLRQKELSVRVLVRDPEKVKSLAEIGAEIVVGDLDSLPSIDKAMKGIKTVVLVSPGQNMLRCLNWAVIQMESSIDGSYSLE